MTIAERAELAAKEFRSGYNCCQAVALALADLTDLTEEQLLKATTGFAAGMGNMEAAAARSSAR